MPNHVHALVRPRQGHELSNILHSWKSFTAHEINKQLGRQGEVWQHEGYDHIIRNPQSLWRIEQYILNNPTSAGLGVNEFTLSPLTEISVGSFTISGGRFATEMVAPPLMRLVPLKDDGTADIDSLNAEFSKEYLAVKTNPRWVAKPTVAYLWARTVTCKNCRATVPLLKTRWLCKKANKRVLLTMQKVEQASGLLSGGNRDGCSTLIFGIENDVPVKSGNAAQRREHDKRIGAGTMSRSGAKCPCCPAIMMMEDIRLEGQTGRLGAVMTTVVVDSQSGKEYRLPTVHEIQMAEEAEKVIPDLDSAFHEPLSPKWNHHQNDGELIDDASRHESDKTKSKAVYEDGMGRAFQACAAALNPDGKMVVVFANKQPDAWETLVSAIIRAGFTVDGSWPIQTEMGNRTRALSSAALASSVWLVCKKRPATARPGWDNKVLEEMRANITTRLREFWDAGIRGPDFVWAATGPALEAYSKHPVVKKANDPGKTMEVGEFLSHVRRMVVDYVVGQVLVGQASGLPSNATETVAPPVDSLDAPTAYYLLHRHDFGLEEAPSGACILYATACGLSDSDLESTWDILVRTGSSSQDEDDENEENEDADPDAEADPDSASDSGSKVKLKTWAQRKHRSMGYEAPGGQPVPLIDRIHRLMHLWRAGDVLKVDEYLPNL